VLTTLIFLPLAGLIIIPFLRGYRGPALVALGVTLVNLALSVQLVMGFDASADGFQFVESIPLMPDYGISYKLGLDGISYWLVLLTTFLFPLVVLGSYSSIKERAAGYYSSILILQTGVLGAFLALDLFLFYIFWEVMLIPMFFIIGIWGGKDRVYATVKFVLFTMIGSLLMLVAVLYLAHHAGSFDYTVMIEKQLPLPQQYWVFAAFALAFLIKVPVFPFHTWLPDAHTEAPAGGSVILAGVLLKLGTYGLLRFNLPLFPEASHFFAPYLMILAVIGIVHGAMAAAVQPDMKRLIAYSSVSHMGYIVLGIFTFSETGIQGSMIQMLNHAVSTGALFFLIGMIYDQTHTRRIIDYGGMAKVVPVFATVFLISTLASVGLPGLNGFIGEYIILVSAFQSDWLIGGIAVSGVILGAWYLLKLYGRVFFGPVTNEHMQDVKDLNLRELTVLAPLLFLMFYMGVYPKPFFDAMAPSIQKNVLSYYNEKESGTEFLDLMKKAGPDAPSPEGAENSEAGH
jgi:NADH-quinone oxidoreductase subunit M